LLADLLLAGRHFQSISTEESVMSKVLAVMIAGLFAAGAYAQNPAGTTPEQGKVGADKSAAQGQAKRASKPQGQVKAPGGDQKNVSEGSGGTTKTAADDAAAARQESRDTRRPGKDGKPKPKTTQGGTPQ
jgi:hypothetical protein